MKTIKISDDLDTLADEIDRREEVLARLGRAVLALEALDARPKPDDPVVTEHLVAYAEVRALARQIAREAME